METEITDPILSPEQESKEIATIAKASIANIEANKKAYEELRDQYKGTKSPDFKDPEFKATLKKLTQGSGALVKARTAATKLGKQETDKLDKVKVMIKSAVEELIAITADTEKEIKAEKERAEQLVADEKAEKERQAEEAKQARIAKLYELGLTHNGSYYSLGDLSITPVQITQFTEAQWEGFVSQATVEFEAIQLKEAEEKEAEVKRIADEKKAADERAEANRKAQEALAKENEAKQKELDAAKAKQKEQDDLIANLQAQLKAQEEAKPVVTPLGHGPVSSGMNATTRINGAPILEEVELPTEDVLNDVLVTEDSAKEELRQEDLNYRGALPTSKTVQLTFTEDFPYIDTMVGKATLRIYPEIFLDPAQDGLTPDMVSATGHISDELLFMVIKPR